MHMTNISMQVCWWALMGTIVISFTGAVSQNCVVHVDLTRCCIHFVHRDIQSTAWTMCIKLTCVHGAESCCYPGLVLV